MASVETRNGIREAEHPQHTVVVEMTGAAAAETSDTESTAEAEPEPDGLSKEITPLLSQNDTPPKKFNIFSGSHLRSKPREQLMRLTEAEVSAFPLLLSWTWGGSRYSGMMCMALSSFVYYLMGAITETLTAQPIPLFESAFTRCTISLILSFLWLQRSAQPIFGPPHARKLLFLRAITGSISLLSFIYSIQRLPLSQSIVLSFFSPILASVMARCILHEKLNSAEIGGLAGSFFGVLFIFQPRFASLGDFTEMENDRSEIYYVQSYHFFSILLGLLSSFACGISYCLIRAGAKASEQPICTVFFFGILASPASAFCAFFFEDFVLPNFSSLVLMIILGVLAFLAQALLARGLQLEATSKVVNLIYLEAVFAQLWDIAASRVSPSFGGLSGCFLILVSVGCSLYFGPEMVME